MNNRKFIVILWISFLSSYLYAHSTQLTDQGLKTLMHGLNYSADTVASVMYEMAQSLPLLKGIVLSSKKFFNKTTDVLVDQYFGQVVLSEEHGEKNGKYIMSTSLKVYLTTLLITCFYLWGIRSLRHHFVSMNTSFVSLIMYAYIAGLSKLAVGHPGYELSTGTVVNSISTNLKNLFGTVTNEIAKEDNGLNVLHGIWNGAWVLGFMFSIFFTN
jgi:hypothetical protein